MMDFFVSIFAELFVQGCEEGSKNAKLPRTIRIILAVVSSLIYLALVGFCVYGTIRLYKQDKFIVMVLVLCVLAILVFAAISYVREIIRLNKKGME